MTKNLFKFQKIVSSVAILIMAFSPFVSLSPMVSAVTPTPSWPTQWTTPNTCITDPGGDVSPSEIDIVGDDLNPAVGFAADDNFQYFRERLSGNPGTASNLVSKSWVVLFQTNKPNYQYLASVTGKNTTELGGKNFVSLWKNNPITEPVDFSPVFGDSAENVLWSGSSASYARVTNDGIAYYIDWAIPVSELTKYGININTTKFFTTSADANNFNKDHLVCYETIADLSVTKNDNADPVNIGDTLIYTISATNNGPDAATSIVVKDTLPTGVTYVSSNPAGSYNSITRELTWNLSSLAASSSQDFTINTTVNQGTDGSTLINNVTVSSSVLDTTPENNSDTEDTTVPPTMYSCNQSYQCVEDSGGTYTTSNCDGACVAPTTTTTTTTVPPTMYSCNQSYQCVEDSGGTYTTSNCDGACVAPTTTTTTTTVPPTMYSCNQSYQCVEDSGGTYTTSNCDGACVAPTTTTTTVPPTTTTTVPLATMYACNPTTLQCAIDASGPFGSLQGCKDACGATAGIGGQYVIPAGVVAGASTEQGEVAGASTTCGPYLLKFIKLGADNDPVEVKKLQSFLNGYLGLNLPVNGIYDQATYEAVKQFQLLLKNEVLAPWVVINCLPSEEIATGYVYRTTTRAINNIFCPTPIPDVSDERCVGGIIIGFGEEGAVSGEGTVLGEATTTPTTTTVTTPLETTETTVASGTPENGVVKSPQNWLWVLMGSILIGGAVYLVYRRKK